MHIEAVRDYCLEKKGVTEEFPFDEVTLVFKIMGKMFVLTQVSKIPFSLNLKCDPDKAIELREFHSEIKPGYHMNKKHWNTIDCTGSLTTAMIYEMIDHSYELVVGGLTKKLKEELKQLKNT